MLHDQLLPVNTATKAESIWRALPYDEFRRNVVALQRVSNEVPGDPKVHSRNEWSEPRIRLEDPRYILPFGVEQRLADDFAFLAAAEEGVKAVSAVGLEQDIEHHGMVIRLTANDSIPQEVPKIFASMFELLGRCARKTLSRKLCSESLFNHVLHLSRERIHGRLQSVHRKVPKHLRQVPREPLHQELGKIAAQLEGQQQRQSAQSKGLIKRLRDVCDLYRRVNSCKEHTDEELQLLSDAVQQSHALATSNGECTIEETLSCHGLDSQEIGSNKVVRQLDKIGRYWGLCIDMAEASRKHGDIFQKLELKILQSYQAIRSSISFVAGKVAKCHVHAEIQLLTFYELNPNLATAKPRVLGVSKSACYLCNMFILKQGYYFITKTHGRLYDLWCVPDLAELAQSQRDKFRQVLNSMNKELRTNLIRERRHTRRNLPLGSYVNLPKGLPQSAVHSSAATLDPVELQSTRAGVESTTGLPEALVAPVPELPMSLGPSMHAVPQTTLPIHIDSVLPEAPTPPALGVEDRSSEITVGTIESVPTVFSHTSIKSWELPFQRILTSNSTFRFSDKRLSAEIEFDGPGQGRVTVSGVAKSRRHVPKNIIDLKEMIPNEIMQVTRADGDGSLVLSLSHGHFLYLQIILEWLS